MGWSGDMLETLARVRHQGGRAIGLAKADGVPVAFGTDLLGHMHSRQSEEFELRLPVQSPADILQSATAVAARLLRAEGRLGVLAAGALADVLLVDGDPTQSIAMWSQPQQGIRLLMQGGRVVRSSLG